MKKFLLNIILLGCIGLIGFDGFSQTTRVKITVDWEDKSYENRVIVQDPGFQNILTIENPDEPYQTTGTSLIYTGVFDLGCVQGGTYKVILFNANDGAWSAGSIKVEVDGSELFSDSGVAASTLGHEISFSVSSDGSGCTPLPDSDGDGVIDVIDLDDDNDGILDTDEALGINTFNCTIPALNFFGNNNTPETGIAGEVGAIYRFENAIFGEPYDVLVEITEKRNTTLSTIDDDTVDNPNYLQARLEFSGNETPADCATCDYPGMTFKFTIVDTGTSTPASTLFRIGGTTWDVDGPAERRESVRYYNPSVYGTDNPTTLEITDVNGDASEIEMTAGGILEGPSFSTLPQLRAYFQFLSNTFTLRMQNVRTTFTAANIREYGMSFTQCDVLDFKSASLIIVNGTDTDGDGLDNHVDFDSDNDGIPDNVEAQATVGYLAPSATVDVNPITGLDVNYDPEAPIPGVSISPVDTDGDEICDFMDFDSDNDGTPDIEETNMANVIVAFTDDDGDGLDNLFEGSDLLDPTDVNDEINNPSSSVLFDNPTLKILPDTDGDLPLGGDLDYRDAIDVYIESATVDFDGIDDHIAEDTFMSGWPSSTLMAWVKLDPTFSADGDVAGQGMMRMYVDGSSRVLRSYYVTSAGSSAYGSSSITALDLDKWYHVAISYEGATGSAKIFINGKLERSTTIPTGTLSVNPGYADPDFNIGRNSRLDNSYFKGAIDEVRVFDVALTEDQVQRMVYQEVENQGGSVTGTLIDKRIVDIGSSTPVPWANLQAYYPMTNILTGKTIDASGNGRDATLKNIFTVQQQTAPMPYQTINDGAWSNANTWKHGTVWDITDIPNLKDWAIVKIASDVDVSQSIRTLGLTIDPGSRLTLNGENAITNNWYLELNGTLDLASDSQLVQGINSDLVTSAAGEILRRQEGNSDIYWYNYWSSPVGTPAATTLSDNNAPTNNTNNTPFSIDMLKDAGGNAMTFTSGFDGSEGVLSDKWLYSYQNGLTYYDWTALTPTSAIVPGVGYTHKGTGFDSNPDMDITEQQYIFQGKPNNGTILLTTDDVTDIYEAANGGESVQDTTLVTSLVGNPYPSALDARQFIADNAGVIEGTIRLWEQWDGASHWLSEYEGGYGFINNLTTERAYQYPGINLADPTGLTPGIKVPSFYIPVGQGFFVEVVTDLGDIEFNNGQRVFIKESDADGVNPENGSSFFREATADTDTTTDDTTTSRDHGEPFQILRLEFSVSSGASRSFVLGFSEDATDGFDYGYDGGLITNPPADDMGSILDGQQYVIQAFAPITPDKEVDLIMHSSGNYSHSIKATEISNFPEAQDLYLYDKLNDSYFDLRNGLKYDFTSVAGTFTDRFEVVFHDGTTLSNQDVVLEDVVLYVKDNALFVKGLEQQPKNLSITNMLGQVVRTFNGVSNSDIENGLQLGELSSGVYLVKLMTENGIMLDKKFILE